ncbi:META domain-containing protein, partial [Escherichia coli]|nr:META domain-containing protein [Escherichia coli]
SNQLAYGVGVRIGTDVLSSQAQLFQARRDLARARYDTIVNGLRLKSAAGSLTEADVIQVNTLLTANGVVSGYSGCNRFSGPYEKLASGMRFGNLVSTRMACDPARMELETAFLEALKSPLATVGMQPSSNGKQGRQVIWK